MTTPIHLILSEFESLGNNCEFGLVQRYAGLENLGLLKFSASPIENLIHALNTNFELYGCEGDLQLYDHSTRYLFCASRNYGFDYNTGQLAGTVDVAGILRKEARKIAYLKRRLLEDLRSGDKIFVRKGDGDQSSGQVLDLMRAVRRHGPSKLLWVRASEDANTASHVQWGPDGLLEGRIAGFAPYDDVTSTELPQWLDLCRRTWQLVHGLPAEPPVQPRNLMPPFRYLWLRHVPERGRDLTVFGPLVDLQSLDRKAVHAFSCWVWIPDSFRGASICPAIGDRRIRWRGADLSLRNSWQKVFVTATLPDEHRRLKVGLVVHDGTEGFFQSSGWRLEESTERDTAPRPPFMARMLTRS